MVADAKPARNASPVADGAQSATLFSGADWSFDLLKRSYDAIEEIALGELGLDTYPNQIEVITSEQMLDAYASIGMPLLYRHWSFGKRFAREETLYRLSPRATSWTRMPSHFHSAKNADGSSRSPSSSGWASMNGRNTGRAAMSGLSARPSPQANSGW